MKKIKLLNIFLVLLVLINFYFFNELIESKEKLSEVSNQVENSLVYISQIEKLVNVGRLKSSHIHSDIAVFVNNKKIDFNIPELEAPEFGSLSFWKNNTVSKFAHMHNGTKNKGVIHVHASNVTLGMFFNSVNGYINSSCLKLPEKINSELYCSNDTHSLTVLVNNKTVSNPYLYEFKDLDQILVSYGRNNKTVINNQINEISNLSCVSSKNC